MKPPPRIRAKRDRSLKDEPQSSRKLACAWQRAEQRKLLNGLKRLSRTATEHGELDYASLRNSVPTRSISEIHSVVESLKDKVISCAKCKLRRKVCEEKKVRKPIQEWTHMASAVTGALEEHISTAFSQMLIVSSTEPCTLRNCDPPQANRPPTNEDGPIDRTVPLRPMPCLTVQSERVGTITARRPLAFRARVPTLGQDKRLPAPSQVVKVLNNKIPSPQQQLSTIAGTSPAATAASQSAVTSCQLGAAETFATSSISPQPVLQIVTTDIGQVKSSSVIKTQGVGSSVIQTAQLPSEQHPTILSTTSASNDTPSSPVPVPSTASSSVASSSSVTSSSSSTHSLPPRSSPAAASHARFDHTSKYATEDNPRMLGVKCAVDFEKIYRYLSVIHKPNEECHLTPMESAIVLDLLMSLPEELPLLDCNKLHKHLIQMYQCLSSPADFRIAREMFKDQRNGFSGQMEAPSGQDGKGTSSQQSTARTADSSDATEHRRTLQPDEAASESSGNSGTSSQSGNRHLTGLCPPLNPFMVPLKLLTRS